MLQFLNATTILIKHENNLCVLPDSTIYCFTDVCVILGKNQLHYLSIKKCISVEFHKIYYLLQTSKLIACASKLSTNDATRGLQTIMGKVKMSG